MFITFLQSVERYIYTVYINICLTLGIISFKEKLVWKFIFLSLHHPNFSTRNRNTQLSENFVNSLKSFYFYYFLFSNKWSNLHKEHPVRQTMNTLLYLFIHLFNKLYSLTFLWGSHLLQFLGLAVKWNIKLASIRVVWALLQAYYACRFF